MFAYKVAHRPPPKSIGRCRIADLLSDGRFAGSVVFMTAV